MSLPAARTPPLTSSNLEHLSKSVESCRWLQLQINHEQYQSIRSEVTPEDENGLSDM
jgi:hypothetical protein